jgi:hypothetical protein
LPIIWRGVSPAFSIFCKSTLLIVMIEVLHKPPYVTIERIAVGSNNFRTPTRSAAPFQRLLWRRAQIRQFEAWLRCLRERVRVVTRRQTGCLFGYRRSARGRDGLQQSRLRIGYRTTPTTARRMVHTGSAAVRCPRTRAEIIAAPRPYEPELIRRCSLIGTTDSPRARPGTNPLASARDRKGRCAHWL